MLSLGIRGDWNVLILITHAVNDMSDKNIQVQEALSDLRWEFIFDDRRKLRLARLHTGRHAWHEGAAAVIACLSTNLGKAHGTVLTEGHS